MRRKLVFQCLIFCACLMITSVAYAVPNLISYQGVLNDGSGQPVSATVNMTFRIYDAATGGAALWNETQSVTVSNGIFNVKLGSIQPLSAALFQKDILYLGIQVGSDSEMAPRQQITTGSYSYKADSIGHSGMPIGTILSWAKDLAGVPALSGGWVECNGQILDDPESNLHGQVIPNLNGENRFLRGGHASGYTTDGLHNHQWIKTNSSSSNAYLTIGSTGTGPTVLASRLTWDPLGNELFLSGVSGSDRLITDGHTSNEEAIPKSYSVVWIIKVK